MVIWGEATNDNNNANGVAQYGVFAKNIAKISEVEAGDSLDDALFLGADAEDTTHTFKFSAILAKLKKEIGEKDHKHSTDDITSGILPVDRGGTGKGTALTANDVGASPSGHTHTLDSLGAAPSGHTHSLDSLGAAPKASPSFTGSISLGRRENTSVGQGSVATGANTEASGSCSHSTGDRCVSVGGATCAEGYNTFCDGRYGGHTEGGSSIAAPTNIYIPLDSYSGAILTVKNDPQFRYLDAALKKITAGMKIYIWNHHYANKLYYVYEIASVNVAERTITLTTDLPASNFNVKNAVVPEIKDSTQYYPAHAEGHICVATGNNSHAEGFDTSASGECAHTEGESTSASGKRSHAEGEKTKAEGLRSHAEGHCSIASGETSHAEGSGAKATGDTSHAEGVGTVASGNYSHAEGSETVASSDYSHAEGYGTIANSFGSHAGGLFNKEMDAGDGGSTSGDAFVIGNGGRNLRSNAFRITFGGTVYGTGAFQTSGADYAEFFEWADENPNGQDRIGRFVTLDGKKIKVAEPGDYVLGIISGNPCIVGNADEDWLGRWIHDDFGRFVKEYLETVETKIQLPDGLADDEIRRWMIENHVREQDGKYIQTTTVAVDHETASWRYKANPDYDPTQPYIERKNRKEWAYVGMLGVLAVLDDGSCQVNGFCHVAAGGIAAAAKGYIPGLTYRVIERVADNIIKVVFR